MNELITINTTQKMSRLEIAEIMEKNHFHVMRDIDKLIAEEAINAPRFGLVNYKDKKGEERPMYELDFQATMTLITGYDAKRRAMVIDRWLKLETGQATPLAVTEAAQVKELTGIAERLDRLEAGMSKMHLSFGSYSTVSGFVHSCCKTGPYGLCVEKDVIYSAYVDFTRAMGQKPEGRSNFCSKIYAGVVGAWASTLTKSGKRVPAIRGIDLLEDCAVIIDDFGARHLKEMEAELEKRRRHYFGDIIPRGYLK